MSNLVLIFFCTVLVALAGSRSPAKGLCVALGLLVTLPDSVRIETGGSLPELTIHRILLLVVLAQTLSSPVRKAVSPPFFGLLLLAALARTVSLFLSVSPGPSFKNLLGFLIEVVLFYWISYLVALRGREVMVKTMFAMVCGLSILAAAIAVDRYTSINPLSMLFPGLPDDSYGKQGTYPHRILFGYAMAMGVPLAMCLLDLRLKRWTKASLWLGLCLMAAACYFSTSRGPWLALGGAVGIIGLLGGAPQKKRCLWIAMLVMGACLLRPGIGETIANKYRVTFDPTTQKGKSYDYRFKLWHVARGEISKSPERMLFGYGGLSTESMDLSRYFEAQAGGTTDKLGYTSWDSRYACDLIEFGVVGFSLSIAIFLGIPRKLFRAWRAADPATKSLLLGIIAAVAVFVFAQSNVDIFSVQLKFLFWAVVAVGFGLVHESYSRARQAGRPQVSERPQPATANVGD